VTEAPATRNSSSEAAWTVEGGMLFSKGLTRHRVILVGVEVYSHQNVKIYYSADIVRQACSSCRKRKRRCDGTGERCLSLWHESSQNYVGYKILAATGECSVNHKLCIFIDPNLCLVTSCPGTACTQTLLDIACLLHVLCPPALHRPQEMLSPVKGVI
jgi:hypothetical protein